MLALFCIFHFMILYMFRDEAIFLDNGFTYRTFPFSHFCFINLSTFMIIPMDSSFLWTISKVIFSFESTLPFYRLASFLCMLYFIVIYLNKIFFCIIPSHRSITFVLTCSNLLCIDYFIV